MNQIIITGSLAYDHIMTFPGKFADHILPDKVHILNVAFNLETLNVDYGGCAGNIAYNLKLLGENPVIHATAGEDFERYWKKLSQLGLSLAGIKTVSEEKTAQAFVMTDLSDNQITAFYPGAMNRAVDHPLMIEEGLVIISPNQKEAMLRYVQHCQEKKIPFIFDPGQTLPYFTDAELKAAAQNSLALILNDYEWQLWQDRTALDEKLTLELTQHLIITLGEKGARILTEELDETIPAQKVEKLVDPTGCGDAFRAGLLYGFKKELPFRQTIELAHQIAATCIKTQGTQNHSINSFS